MDGESFVPHATERKLEPTCHNEERVSLCIILQDQTAHIYQSLVLFQADEEGLRKV